MSLAVATGAGATTGTSAGTVTASPTQIDYHGLSLTVPANWRVVDLRQDPHACVRFDRATAYVGHTGDQTDCPAKLLGGAAWVHVEALDRLALRGSTAHLVTVHPGSDPGAVSLNAFGVTRVAVEGAGVLVTVGYGDATTAEARDVLASITIGAAAQPRRVDDLLGEQVVPQSVVTVPGTIRAKGFDTCAAPGPVVMQAWRAHSPYNALGIYIGGANAGCDQAYLTPAYVANQSRVGWHLIPTYVGRQAPCSGFRTRIDADHARSQGGADADDAIKDAQSLGIAPPSTIFNDMEGYDTTVPGCSLAVLRYLTAWSHELHGAGYRSGVYASAASGIHDLSTQYRSSHLSMPDNIWIAWWNGHADTAGGPYVPPGQWNPHQRMHQYAGNVNETYGGHTLMIDRNFNDVAADVQQPKGCPTSLNYRAYPYLHSAVHRPEVTTAQCLLARAGFDPGAATGIYGSQTASAARAFKVWAGLSGDDSSLGRWAWTAVLSAGSTAFLHTGSHGAVVRKLQRALTARLGHRVHISGRFDAATRQSVLRYQRLVHLNQTGTVGVPTWRALQSGS